MPKKKENVKSTVKISSIFVAFIENMNFTYNQYSMFHGHTGLQIWFLEKPNKRFST